MSDPHRHELQHSGPCCYADGQANERVCENCLEVLRSKGVPEHTLRWLQQDKLDRIRTVMF